MRSILFVPATGGTMLDKAMASGADGVILDLEDSITPERKGHARAAALEFLKSVTGKKDRPRLLVRINGLDTGMTDADLDAVLPGKPDAVVFPKAEGAATVVHLDAKLTAREAIVGLPEGSVKILAQAVESAAGLFAAGSYRGASARLIGLTWGRKTFPPNSAPKPTATPAACSPSRTGWRAISASMARRRPSCRRSKPSTPTSAIRKACGATR